MKFRVLSRVLTGSAILSVLSASAYPTNTPAPATPVCATDTLDHLPVGVSFSPSIRLLERVRSQLAAETDTMRRSSFDRQEFSVFFSKKFTWSDGSEVALTCRIKTSLHDLERGDMTVTRTQVEVLPLPPKKPPPPAGPGWLIAISDHIFPPAPPPIQSPPWRKFTYEMRNPDSVFPSQLICESESSPVKDRPLAPFERTLLSIGQLEDTILDDLPMRVVTDNSLCSAGVGQSIGAAAGAAAGSSLSGSSLTGSGDAAGAASVDRASKGPLPPAGEPPAPAPPGVPAGGAGTGP